MRLVVGEHEDGTVDFALDVADAALEVWPESHWPNFALCQTDV